MKRCVPIVATAAVLLLTVSMQRKSLDKGPLGDAPARP